MSELKSNTINEFFKVQQISDYQRAFEELRNKMESREIKRRDTKQFDESPANDNDREISQDKAASVVEQAANDNDDLKEYIRRGLSKKSYCCVLF